MSLILRILIVIQIGAYYLPAALAETLDLPVNAQPLLVNDNFIDADLNSSDADLFIFYAEAGSIFTIRIPDESVSASFDPQLEVFSEDGNALFTEPFDFNFAGEGEELVLNLMNDGFYYIRISENAPEPGVARDYQILVFEPTAPQGGTLKGKVLDACNNQPVARADISLSTQFTLSHSTGDFIFSRVNPGNYDISVHAEGFESATFPVTITELGLTSQDFSLTPDLGCDVSTSPESQANYDFATGLLQLDNVEVGALNYRASLENIAMNGNFIFQLKSAELITSFETPAVASYDTDSLHLNIAVVSALDQHYRVILINQGDFIFQIESVDLIE